MAVGSEPSVVGTAVRRRPPYGVLVLPFVLGTGITLLLVLGTGQDITASWIGAAVVVGVLAAAASLTAVMHKPTAASVALREEHRAPGKPDRTADPLAHVQQVEQTGRVHRRPCTNCGTLVKVDDDKCANCGHSQTFPCKGCRATVRLHWTHCPECGRTLP